MAAPVNIFFMDHPSSFETDQKPPPKGAMERTNMRFSKKVYRLKNKTLSIHIYKFFYHGCLWHFWAPQQQMIPIHIESLVYSNIDGNTSK